MFIWQMVKRRSKGLIYIGTSGWSYDWDDFYPKGFPSKKRLEYFSQYFSTSEVNYSFYRLPKKSTFEKWKKETPKNFVFGLKLSRYITHIKRLYGIKAPLEEFLSRAKSLDDKLGPILVQLPPNFKIDTKRLEYFLKTLGKVKKETGLSGLRVAFEFRHRTWFDKSKERKEALKILEKNNAAFVFADSVKYPEPEDEPITADFLYFRFHGPGELFASEYGRTALQPWAKKIRRFLTKGLDIYVYFNNDACGYALKDAAKLRELIL
jgi:uncharacterized protein YecE (DUF72 family)